MAANICIIFQTNKYSCIIIAVLSNFFQKAKENAQQRRYHVVPTVERLYKIIR